MIEKNTTGNSGSFPFSFCSDSQLQLLGDVAEKRFAAVIRKKIVLKPFDLSSLENNMLVVEILQAAIESAKTPRTVKLN